MADSDDQYFDKYTKETAETLRKAQLYVQMAIEQGDSAVQERAGEIKIIIRPKKGEK